MEPLAALMLLVVSIDRFILVCCPVRYLKLRVGYAYWLCGLAYGFSFVAGLVGYGFSYAQDSAKVYRKVTL